MDLLRKRDEQRTQRNESLRQQAREQLRNALHHLAPGEQVLIFGSLTQPGKFHESSDIDIAFVEEPRASRYGLQSQIEEMGTQLVERPQAVMHQPGGRPVGANPGAPAAP